MKMILSIIIVSCMTFMAVASPCRKVKRIGDGSSRKNFASPPRRIKRMEKGSFSKGFAKPRRKGGFIEIGSDESWKKPRIVKTTKK